MKKVRKHSRNGEIAYGLSLSLERSTNKRLLKRNSGCSLLRRAKKLASRRPNLPGGLAFPRHKLHAWKNAAMMRIPSIACAAMYSNWVKDVRLILLCDRVNLGLSLPA